MKPPTIPKSFDPAIFESKLAKLAPELAIRARNLFGLWMDGKSSSAQNKELMALGFIPDVAGLGIKSKYCNSAEAARRLSSELNQNIDRARISDRKKAWRGEEWWSTIFCANHLINYPELKRRWTGSDSGSYSGESVSDDAAKRRLNNARAIREERKNEHEQRRFDGQWMLTGTAYFVMDAFGVTLKNILRDAMERQLPQQIETIVKECVIDESARQNLIEKMRPIFSSKFDQIQIDIGFKLDEIGRDAEEMNRQQKEENK